MSLLSQRVFLTLLGLLLSSCSRYHQVESAKYTLKKGDVAITQVHALSADGLSMLPETTVILSHGKIAHVGNAINLPEDIRVINGQGKFLIPGLIDSHAHLSHANDLLVFAAFGITYVREMLGNTTHLNWKQSIETGNIGPRIFVASEKIASKTGFEGLFDDWFKTRINISDPELATEFIESLMDEGFQAAKISSFLNKEMYIAITQAAHKKNFPVVGHLPHSIKLADLWVSGQSEIAHLEELTKALNNEFGGYNHESASNFLEYVKARSDDVAKHLKIHKISVSTSLWYMESLPQQALDLERLISTQDLSFSNPDRVNGWLPGNNPFELPEDKKLISEVRHKYKIIWQTYVKAIHIMLKALNNHQVHLLAGTDPYAPMVIPGRSLHQELQSLVNMGMSPEQALLSATRIPADWMKVKTGRISPGYDADLLLLNKNPLSEIKHTLDIDSVFLKGQEVHHMTLEQIIQDVRRAYSTLKTK